MGMRLCQLQTDYCGAVTEYRRWRWIYYYFESWLWVGLKSGPDGEREPTGTNRQNAMFIGNVI